LDQCFQNTQIQHAYLDRRRIDAAARHAAADGGGDRSSGSTVKFPAARLLSATWLGRADHGRSLRTLLNFGVRLRPGRAVNEAPYKTRHAPVLYVGQYLIA
jgi:hypothetical protein